MRAVRQEKGIIAADEAGQITSLSGVLASQ